MKRKKIIIVVLILVLILGIAFYLLDLYVGNLTNVHPPS